MSSRSEVASQVHPTGPWGPMGEEKKLSPCFGFISDCTWPTMTASVGYAAWAQKVGHHCPILFQNRKNRSLDLTSTWPKAFRSFIATFAHKEDDISDEL